MMRNPTFAARLFRSAIATVIVTTLPVAAFAADAAKEAATGGMHAGLAAKAATIDQVHMHLHHAVNCLVGPKGQGFDAKEANPCQALGDGAIPDTTDAAMKAKLTSALAHAQAGLKSTDLAAAQKAAAETEAALK
jgi:hypothetical protein